MSMSTSDGPITDINVTPLVDVSLVLVIIFMVTAPLFSQPVMKVDIPKAVTNEGKEQENVTITINSDEKVAINAKEVTKDEMKGELKLQLQKSAEKVVVIRADKMTNHGIVVELLDMAKDLGAKSLVFATEQKK
jgi:biopolymer transport protein ExbD